jgi:hypothetical protein
VRIALTGASGFLGGALATVLTAAGHEVVRMVRRAPRPGEIGWDPESGRLDRDAVSGLDAVVHLAGENLAGRWTEAHRRRIRRSRVEGTALLATTLARAALPPRVLVSASAIGIYGHRGDEVLDETSPPGQGFLPEVGRAWEAAAGPARDAGIRTVLARFGLVLSRRGGVLRQMLPPFELGLGARLGDGRQWMSWIGLDDALGALLHALSCDELAGPANLVAPEPVRNAVFTEQLARVLRRPAIFAIPGFALRLLFDGLADEGLLASTRVRPAALEATGYRFRHPTLEGALRHALGRREHG